MAMMSLTDGVCDRQVCLSVTGSVFTYPAHTLIKLTARPDNEVSWKVLTYPSFCQEHCPALLLILQWSTVDWPGFTSVY